MAGFTIRYEGGALHRALESIRYDLHHMKPAWQEAGEILQRSIDETFRQQGRPDRWKPLAASTLYTWLGGRKARTQKGDRLRKSAERKLARRKILQASGLLRDNVAYQADDLGVDVGSVKVYAAIHQLGGEAGRRSARVRIPARPFLVVQPEDEREIAGILDRFFVGGEHVLG
jgi:phage virion morphogenesis protein